MISTRSILPVNSVTKSKCLFKGKIISFQKGINWNNSRDGSFYKWNMNLVIPSILRILTTFWNFKTHCCRTCTVSSLEDFQSKILKISRMTEEYSLNWVLWIWGLSCKELLLDPIKLWLIEKTISVFLELSMDWSFLIWRADRACKELDGSWGIVWIIKKYAFIWGLEILVILYYEFHIGLVK